jgi:glycosyltransferase involved in cell wall biosynthesis
MSPDAAFPKVSIGIPTRNREAYLRLAVGSILAQTYPNLEVVVSDNASDDGTAEYLASLTDSRFRIIRQDKNLGMVGNFNACLFAATGDLFLLLSDDDVLAPDAIEALSAPFLAAGGDKVGLSWCPSTIIDADGKAMWNTEAGPVREAPVDLLVGVFNGRRGTRLSAVMVRRSDSISLGGYDERRHGVLCDTGNWGRIALGYDVICCNPKSLVQYRVHPASLTQSANCADWQRYGNNMHEDFLTVLKEANMPTEAKRLADAFPQHLANITVTVLLRFVRQPGWVSLFAREFWRSRRFMLTPFVAGRILRDGWKLLRI